MTRHTIEILAHVALGLLAGLALVGIGYLLAHGWGLT